MDPGFKAGSSKPGIPTHSCCIKRDLCDSDCRQALSFPGEKQRVSYTPQRSRRQALGSAPTHGTGPPSSQGLAAGGEGDGHRSQLENRFFPEQLINQERVRVQSRPLKVAYGTGTLVPSGPSPTDHGRRSLGEWLGRWGRARTGPQLAPSTHGKPFQCLGPEHELSQWKSEDASDLEIVWGA